MSGVYILPGAIHVDILPVRQKYAPRNLNQEIQEKKITAESSAFPLQSLNLMNPGKNFKAASQEGIEIINSA